MPIRWSALKVSEALDEVEAELNLAKPFIDKAMTKVKEISELPHLPQYMDNRLWRLIHEVEERCWGRITASIGSIRDNIPQEEIETERQRGIQQGLNL